MAGNRKKARTPKTSQGLRAGARKQRLTDEVTKINQFRGGQLRSFAHIKNVKPWAGARFVPGAEFDREQAEKNIAAGFCER